MPVKKMVHKLQRTELTTVADLLAGRQGGHSLIFTHFYTVQ